MKSIYTILKFIFFIIYLNNSCYGQLVSLEKKYPIIPSPQEISYGETELSFETITLQNTVFKSEANKLIAFFKENGIIIANNGLKINFIKPAISKNSNEEAYSIQINSDVTVTANTEKGAFYAIQTLKQLLRKNKNKGLFPKINIKDWPAFKIRGFMHDTGRNFQSVEQLKEQLEVLSNYKYNIFHWHLTDDPAWRLESKLYPELQDESATSRHKGKFYTQEDFKEIVAFCKERQITVIPEFDIPGHSKAFRSAFDFESMRDEKALPVLLDLFKELICLTTPEDMPYIHIGTDEVRNKEEYVSEEFILEIMNFIKSNNRELIVWKEGIEVAEDSTSINQLWAQHTPRKGHRFIDSRANYINHLDPFAGMSRLFFQQPCRQPQGDFNALGGILCAWPDNNIANERDLLKQNPIYPSIVFYSDAIWKGREKDCKEYWAKLPKPNSKEFNDFKQFEEKVITHRNLFFEGKEFPYVNQTSITWKIIGPFNHKGDFNTTFEVEKNIKDRYKIAGKTFTWNDSIIGGTIHLKHFFGFPSYTNKNSGTYYAYSEIYSPYDRVQDFWIGFQGWSRSGGRRVGPFPNIGQWHTTNPKIWVNKQKIEPPIWKQPNLATKTDEIPFIDEDYFYRNPTKVNLKKGWNSILLKIPHGGNSWKWMFTCIPINIDKSGVKEVKDLKFRTTNY